MADGLLEKLVEEDFGIEGRGKWYHSSEHDSLVVNAEEQTWFWNSKNLRGGVLDYLIQVRGMKKPQAQEFLNSSFVAFKENSEIGLSSHPYEKLVDLMWANGIHNREYWYKRCLTDETIDRMKLGYYDGWNTIPIYESGNYVNSQCRRDEPEKSIMYWYKTGRVYLYNEGILPFTKVVYITEGLVDCILLNQLGLPSVSAGGVNTWQDVWFSKFCKIDRIFYFEDNDTAGRIGARKIADSLGTYRVKIVSFPDKKNKYDVGDWFKDNGTKDILLEYVDRNNKYIFELEQPPIKSRKHGRKK